MPEPTTKRRIPRSARRDAPSASAKAPIKTRTKTPGTSAARAADAIAKGIVTRRYLIGQRLIEAELMRELDVGRSTVREALKTLAARGVVELIPFRGAVIRELTRADGEELLVVLEVLCGLAARLAAERINVGDNRKRFVTAARPLTEAVDADALRRILDERPHFYQVMFEIAGNRELDSAVPIARAHQYRSQLHDFATHADLKSMMLEYRAIVEAILEGDGRKAEARMRSHLEKTAARTLPRLRRERID